MVCVGEVASSRAWCMSMEYDVSLEDVVVVAPKEQKIKKNAN